VSRFEFSIHQNGSAYVFRLQTNDVFNFVFNSYLLVCFSEALALESPRMDVQNSTIPGSTPGRHCFVIMFLTSAPSPDTKPRFVPIHILKMWEKTDFEQTHFHILEKPISRGNEHKIYFLVTKLNLYLILFIFKANIKKRTQNFEY
jgi:hypothetical protein